MVENKRTLFLNVLWLLVPSVVWSVVFHSAAFCVDPLIVQAFGRRLPKPWIFFVRFAWALLFVVPLLYIWNISPGTYLFFVREALPFSPPSVLISVAVALVSLSWFIVHKGFEAISLRASRQLLIAGGLILVLKFAIIVLAGSANATQKRLKSPAMTAIGMWYEAAFVRNEESAVPATPQSSFNAYARAHPLPSKVVLMVVESWGETADGLKQIGAEMQSNRLAVVKTGFTAYRGSTLSGELRELCSQYIAPTDGLVVKENFDCAPRFLARAGYQTLGIHAYDGAFYARKTFWKRFGLANRWFGEDLKGAEECPGPFRAACDEEIIRRGVDWLETDASRRFLYLLTLSSHEAIDPAALARPPGKYFSDIQAVHPTQQIARRALSSLIVELQRGKPGECVLAYAVGDHAPPSAPPAMFPPNQVPYILFSYNCPAP